MDYLKIGKAEELAGKDRRFYRVLEIIPGFLSWFTLLALLALSYLTPVFVAFFMIAFDVYWLLLVIFLGIHLIASYFKLKKNLKIDWKKKCMEFDPDNSPLPEECLKKKGVKWQDVIHLVILPTYNENLEIIRTSFESLTNDTYPSEKMIVVLAVEERAGGRARENAAAIEKEFGHKFRHFKITVHPDNIPGELKGKGANQAWAARQVKKDLIDTEKYDYDLILASVFDIDTVVEKGYFYRLTYAFLTAPKPHRVSYQPVPVYHNNIWQAPFFARVAASSNTFWQMMQQIRQEKLATYSSHSMSWRALTDIGFWSTTMISEDSRIFWHCFLYYNGDYRVMPLHFPVSMDVTMDETRWQTAKNLYKQQRRWGWGVENLPYLVFNGIKRWNIIPKRKLISRVFVQLHGFHSWATNALIIAVIGWMPMFLGGDRFNATVLSTNLPNVARILMTAAMSGLILSAIISTLLLPKKPKKYGVSKYIKMAGQWVILPISIIVFGSIPGLDAQTRLMLNKRLDFFVTPKKR